MVGFINVNKDKGVSSAFVVNKIKRALKVKCGHMGTLDPLAHGVLPIGLGQASRAFDFMLGKEKTYLAEFDFGYSTPSFDLETSPDAYAAFLPTLADVESVLPFFKGEIMQVPPAYSAKFVDGSRSYKLARKGKRVELEAKPVTIFDINIVDQTGEGKFLFKIDCSAGTYIRSLVRDIAEKLGVCGTMTDLTRTKSGFFTLENSVTLDELIASENKEKFIIAPDKAIELPVIVLDKERARRLINGLYDDFDYPDGEYKLYNETEFWGIAAVAGGKIKMRSYIRDL